MSQNPQTFDERLAARVAEECTPIDMEARFDDMLEECYNFDSVGGPFSGMSPSRVLREVDPIAHRCGVNDYADSISSDSDVTEIDGEYYDTRDVDAIREELEAEDAEAADEAEADSEETEA